MWPEMDWHRLPAAAPRVLWPGSSGDAVAVEWLSIPSQKGMALSEQFHREPVVLEKP